MPHDPAAIKTMKQFYGDRLYVEDKDVMNKEFEKANDRTIIITCGAQIDSVLELILAAHMPYFQGKEDDAFSNAFRFEGPMGPFSSRIELAYYLGLIDERMKGQLTDLRHIRNAVAHARRHVSFEDVPLQNAVRRLFAPAGMFSLRAEDADGFRRCFIAEFGMIYTTLMDGREAAVEAMRQSFIDDGRGPPF